jgi:ATP-dependent exoDNAse (exonuclease V) beta subunit
LLASKARELGLFPADARRAAELLEAALGSAILRRARSARACYSEVPFSIRVGDVLLTGAMDLLFAESDGVVVVDYKTDAARGEAELARLAAAYRPQMLAYALAAQRTLCKPVKEVVLCFLSSGWEWVIPITEAALREAEMIVASSA